MRTTLAAFTAAISIAAVALVAGCSGGSQGPTTLVPTSGMTQTQSRSLQTSADRTGVAPKYLSAMRTSKTSAVRPGFFSAMRAGETSARSVRPEFLTGLTDDLFVSDIGLDEVLIFDNATLGQVGTITNKISGPDGEWVDLPGDVYVTNVLSLNIEEYGRSTTAPSFTYSAGMTDPVEVTTDTANNVYEADFFGGFVNEYAQNSNKVIESCSPGGAVEGVAVDKNGDVFTDYQTGSGGLIAEYKGGLAGCNEKVLGVTLSYAGGMALDNHQNLIVCDQTAPAVDVIKKPYTSITSTLGSGFTDPFHVTINQSNTLAYVTQPSTGNVYILNYPSGTVAAIGIFSEPLTAVDAPNAVY